MKLATVRHSGRIFLAAIDDDGVIDLQANNVRVPATLRALLGAGEHGLRLVRSVALSSTSRIPLANVELLAPIADPQKFLGLGFAYRSHVAELVERRKDIHIPPTQIWFNKQVSCIVGPYADIHKPAISEQMDYEGEMAMVIGTRCRQVRARDASRVIAGYMVCNDVSVRDWQARAPTATLGKSFDTHGPTGPWLTLSDEVADPESLNVKTWVNGDLRQDNCTSDFIYSLGQMIEELTTCFTLEPGDILTTGTPRGVGAALIPPRYLRVGDTVRVEVGRLGHIENRVIEEPRLDLG
jgi:2-keto-4-pentenoate hydratase/2-oxohepta-3-ene-1,7-dioic acid hydratase in catechol pathway